MDKIDRDRMLKNSSENLTSSEFKKILSKKETERIEITASLENIKEKENGKE